MMALRMAPCSRQGEHLVAAGLVEGVVEGGAAAGAELVDAGVEKGDVVGEVLRKVGLDVKAFDEGAVVLVEDLGEELAGGVLLELKATADGGAGVEHEADAEGQVGLLSEADDGFGALVIVEQAEVLLAETGDEVALFVGHGEDEIDFEDAGLEGREGEVGVGGLVLRGAGGERGGWSLGCRLGGRRGRRSGVRWCGLGVGECGQDRQSCEGEFGGRTEGRAEGDHGDDFTRGWVRVSGRLMEWTSRGRVR